MDYKDVVARYADEWRALIAWRAPLPATVTLVEFVKHKNTRKLGFAKPWSCEARVYLTGKTADSLARDLATLLHELAHLAAPNYVKHEQPWREIFVAGTIEALKLGARTALQLDVFDLDVSIVDLDAQVVTSTRRWLDHTGTTAVLRAINVLEG